MNNYLTENETQTNVRYGNIISKIWYHVMDHIRYMKQGQEHKPYSQKL